ncbi:LysR family transcriptional regulator [Yoonia sp.]|uniref:LysR family transcriptional regulator n=1 Tax=Yoonia sp. TaxID=2212373 RepID=UPI002E01BC47|nr:LysR family transcriptional regulator [Yoonia sp.]
MVRNLDLTALRSFVAVSDAGGVTRAAGMLNLTQSAVSMQLKRLEESLDVALLDRTARTIALTPAGEQLLGYARSMLATNDEILNRLTATEFEGELKLGVPHDIIYPVIPAVLKRFAAEFPRMQVRLISAPTRKLLPMHGRGEVDLILTTEETCGPDGQVLIELPLIWIGAEDGVAWRRRPLPVAFCKNCIFRSGVLQALNADGIDWNMAVDSDHDSAIEAAVSADLAVHVSLKGCLPPHTVPVEHGGLLPALKPQNINLYVLKPEDQPSQAMARIIQQCYDAPRLAPQLLTA